MRVKIKQRLYFRVCVHQLCGEKCEGEKLSDDFKEIKKELKKLANQKKEENKKEENDQVHISSTLSRGLLTLHTP